MAQLRSNNATCSFKWRWGQGCLQTLRTSSIGGFGSVSLVLFATMWCYESCRLISSQYTATMYLTCWEGHQQDANSIRVGFILTWNALVAGSAPWMDAMTAGPRYSLLKCAVMVGGRAHTLHMVTRCCSAGDACVPPASLTSLCKRGGGCVRHKVASDSRSRQAQALQVQ